MCQFGRKLLQYIDAVAVQLDFSLTDSASENPRNSHWTKAEMLRRWNRAFDAHQQPLVAPPPVAEPPDVLKEQNEPTEEVNDGLSSLSQMGSNAAMSANSSSASANTARIYSMTEEVKQDLLDVLQRALSKQDTSTDFIMAYFKFACTCRADRLKPKTVLGDLLPQFRNNVLQLMPRFDSELYTFVNLLGREHASALRSLRSGLEFFKEDIVDEHHYIEMERFRQQQGHIVTVIRTLERERNSLNESGQNPKRVLEIGSKLSKMNEEAEHCRQQIEKHMDMYHAYSNDHLKQATLAKQNTEKLVQKKKELLAKQERLRQEGETAEADRMNKGIEKLDKDIIKGKAETEKHREKFHDNQKKTIENAATKALYDKFRREAKRGVAKTYVDNDGRVIQAVLEMDAKQVFHFLAENKATICFFNGETLDLLIDGQLPVHPRTIQQLISADRRSPDTGPSPTEDFREILKLTTAHQIESSVFREKVNKILQKHRMCTLDEVNALKQDIDKVLISPTDQCLFENMTPAEAYRLKVTISTLEFNGNMHDDFKIAKVAAGVRLAKDLNLHGNIFGTADCIEVIDNYAGKMASSLKTDWDNVKSDPKLSLEQKSIRLGILRTEYLIADDTWLYTKNTARAWKTVYTKGLGQINSSAYESMLKELRSDMQVVENFCHDTPHPFASILSATYHFRKHLFEALKHHFGSEADIPKNLSREQELEIYFKKVPNDLSTAGTRPLTFLQNGLAIKSTWEPDYGFFEQRSMRMRATMVYEGETARHHYIEMERFRQQQEDIVTVIRTLERERNSLNESGQNPERVLEIGTKLSTKNEEAENCRQQIEKHMDMYHAYSNDHLKQATLAKQNTEKLVQKKKELLAKQERLRQESLGLGLCLGLCLSLCLGLCLDLRLGLGIGLGVTLSLALKIAEADSVKKDIEKLDKDITEGKAETKKHRMEFHRSQKRTMEKAATKALEIGSKLSKMNEEAEHCRQQIEKHMDMYHAYSNDHLKQATLAKQNTEKLVQKKKELLAKQERLRQEGETAEADRMNKGIEKLDKDIIKGKAETEKHREKFHDNQKKTIENAATKALYDKFRREAKRGVAKTYVDNDGRVIQAVLEMDAKQVFHFLAENKATICFFNGETLDLLIDGQLPVHPRTIQQLISADRRSPDTGPSPTEDFREILKLTTAHQIESSVFREKVSNFRKHLFGALGHARPLRSMCSGLEFFHEDIVDETSTADLKEIFKNFMQEGDAPDELDSKLKDYAGNRAEWDTGSDPVDLRAVPSTHTWWSELERNDSVAKFRT